MLNARVTGRWQLTAEWKANSEPEHSARLFHTTAREGVKPKARGGVKAQPGHDARCQQQQRLRQEMKDRHRIGKLFPKDTQQSIPMKLVDRKDTS